MDFVALFALLLLLREYGITPSVKLREYRIAPSMKLREYGRVNMLFICNKHEANLKPFLQIVFTESERKWDILFIKTLVDIS